MGIGNGFGKVILFNEHFVVYGIPSIVSAISDRTTATVAEQRKVNDEQFVIVDSRPETPGYKKKKNQQQWKSIGLMLDYVALNLLDKTLNIEFSGNLLAASGVGSSAASCAAFARALNDEYGLGMGDHEINQIAYEGEKAYHGRPSGVDNTAATYGGLIQFTKGEVPKFDHINVPKPVEIVIGNTGLVTNTEKAVEGVKNRMQNYQEKYNNIFEQARELIPKARSALENGNYKVLGELMFENHNLLQQIEVSCPELDQLVRIAEENGALGAKMTGSGLGGYMVALTPGNEVQEKVASAIENEGYKALRTTIGIRS